MNLCKTVSLLCLLAFSSLCHAQSDTGKSRKQIRPLFIPLSDLENLNGKLRLFDTSLNGFHQLNPYRRQNMAYQDLGLIGTPIQALSLSAIKQPGFDLGFNRLNDWLYGSKGREERLVVSPSAYTMLNYSQGEKELIFIELLHTQNITRRWNVGLDYRRLKTNNYLFFDVRGGDVYTKLRVPSIYNLRFFTSYRSRNDKYYVLGSVVYNKITLRETGGLSSEAAFDTTSGKRRVFENPLANASNTLNQPAVYLKQMYRFGKTTYQTRQKDSSHRDTLGFDFAPRGYFYHSLHASRTIFKYIDADADTPYYPAPIFDNGTLDSISLKELSNAAGIVFKTGYRGFSNLIKLGAEHSNYGVFNSHGGQLAYYNFSVSGDLRAALNAKAGEIELLGKGQFFMAGYNQKDFLLQASVKIRFSDKFRLNAQLSSQRHRPDYFQSRAYTNHLVWVQSLAPTFRNGLDASVEWLPWDLKAGLSTTHFQNYYLYYFSSRPQGADFSYLELYLKHLVHLGKFTWHNRISSQQVTATYHLPKWSLSGGWYFENRFFKKNMLARIGIDYYWYSSYYADAYNPYLRQFVWQDRVKIGNYPYFDFYVSAQIRTMNLFFRFEHFNQGLSGNRYYATPLYPNPPRFFRLGINWRLFN